MPTQQTTATPVQPGWHRGDATEHLITREWLITNALGGYASGTLGGVSSRRFHGILIAALRAPLGRTMMFNHLEEVLSGPGICFRLSADEHGKREVNWPEPDFLEEFVLERGLPVWRYSKNGIRIEKRMVMPHVQNSTYVCYRLLEGPPGLTLQLRPSLHFRPHEGLVTESVSKTWSISESGDGEFDLDDGCGKYPQLRLKLFGRNAQLERSERTFDHVLYRVERSRGYEHEGALWSPGVMRFELNPGDDAGFIASVESWDVVRTLPFEDIWDAENERRLRLLGIAKRDEQLVLAADQFIIHPHTRVADEARVRAAGDEPRTIIAGYHWFTDWGRDTMISLEGLTLVTGRHREAGNILRTFASYIRDGLIPNLFPEGEHGGLYHTADATMWFFHAIWRYLGATQDRETVRAMIPRLLDIVDHHVRGTRFNIHVDPADGLLSQGQEGYQLTWMDAKVDGWVVTPRRGKAVEINALYYNALRILEQLLLMEGDEANAHRIDDLADRCRRSFNELFWYEDGQYLYDVLGDPSLRPNQIFAISLDFPVLDEARWARIVEVVERELVTPVGLRSLARSDPDYKPAYDGDLRARDAAYHQGTVWSWLIGPFIDAWLKVHPKDLAGARRFLDGFQPHLADACIGTISEVFDAEPPYTPRGCAAQAWGVAEVLRAGVRSSVSSFLFACK
ncbi:MAG TPA: amylo-alpha-1,6-glucosidase [Thermoanaerobaculia bacterium]|jgi:predicted glycogen debranching enzyme